MALPDKDTRSVGSAMQEQIDNPTETPQQAPAQQPLTPAQNQPANTQPVQPETPAPGAK